MPNFTISENWCFIGYAHQCAPASFVSWDSKKHHGGQWQLYESI